MALATDIRKTVTDSTPVYAALGATDLAVERVRAVVTTTPAEVGAALLKAQARAQASAQKAQKAVSGLEPAKVQATLQRVPATVVAKALEAVGKAESGYGDLAVRGRDLVARIRGQRQTQDLIASSKVTLSRGKATVTSVKKTATTTRKRAAVTRTTAKGAATSARKTAKAAAAATEAAAEKVGD